ncbi:MAG: radical SAM protein [Armatimonadetes bacterium]|nr:radical SAM protein [Armatimonadota bacterium]
MAELRVHARLARSRANGPGCRAVIWVQGCTLGCLGCFNPQTHPGEGGVVERVDELVAWLLALSPAPSPCQREGWGEVSATDRTPDGTGPPPAPSLARRGYAGIEGVTISGGEPLQQAGAVIELLARLRAESALSTLLFTGFEWAEVRRMPFAAELLAVLDVLIAGRYRQDRPLGRGLRGSANQTVHCLTGRYRPSDLEAVPVGEAVIGLGGEVVWSGVTELGGRAG